MSDTKKIIEKLNASNVQLVGDPVQDASDSRKFYAFINVDRSNLGRQEPSNYKLRRLSEYFEQESLIVSFIIVEDTREDLLSSLKTTLFRFFHDSVRNVFISPESKHLIVWVEPKKILTQDEHQAIASKIDDILRVLEVTNSAIKFTSSENIPTPTACLNVIRLKAPLTLERLHTELGSRDFHIPSQDWLTSLLDKLRRAGVIIRKKDGNFVLTLAGLHSLGTKKNRRSPDINRALDIARHGS